MCLIKNEIGQEGTQTLSVKYTKSELWRASSASVGVVRKSYDINKGLKGKDCWSFDGEFGEKSMNGWFSAYGVPFESGAVIRLDVNI